MVSARIVGAAVFAMVGIYLLLSHNGSFGDGIDRWLGTNYTLLVWMVLLLVVGAVTAFANNGLLVSILVVAAPLVGYVLSGNIMFATEPTLAKRMVYAGQATVVYGLPIGIIGYGLGRGLQTLRR